VTVANKIQEKLEKLVRMLGSDNVNERENARRKIDDILVRNKWTWNDLPELLRAAASAPEDNRPNDNQAPNPDINPFDLVHYILQQYVALTPHEYVAVALWVIHTHAYDRFMVTPRLAVTSPVRGCGKTILLSIISSLAARVLKTDGITPAAIYRLVDAERRTLLVDEADNLGLGSIGPLRAVLNSGHRKGGSITRFVGDRPRQFSTFAPLALAAIGNLPLPVMHRSIVVQIDRHDGARELRRFDENDPALNAIYREICLWAKNCNLAQDPEMPAELRNRQADNWRPLIAIADACRQGNAAREAAIAFACKARPGVILLCNIRALFDAHRVDRLASAAIIEALNGLEDGLWSEWRGIADDQHPHRLSQGELARLLAAFGIRPRTIWPTPRGLQTKSFKGYYRSQFEAAWKSYCSDGTPSQSSNFRYLHRA